MFGSLVDVLARRAETFIEAPAFTLTNGSVLTFGAWHESSRRVARQLCSRGLRPGDRVGLAFHDTEWTQACIAFTAVLLAGGVAVPLRRPAGQAWRTEVLTALRIRVLLHGDRSDTHDCDTVHWSAAVGDLVAAPPPPVRLPPPPAPGSPASVLLTSGTTRVPQAVECTHEDLVHDWAPEPAAHGKAAPDVTGAASGIFVTSLPWGCNAAQAMVCSVLSNVMNVLLQQPFHPPSFHALTRRDGVVGVGLVPSQARALIAESQYELPVDRVRTVVCSSAPLDAGTVEGLHRLYPSAQILNVYTMTEGGGSLVGTCTPGEEPTLGLPDDPASCRIVTREGRDAAPSEVGELHLLAARPTRTYVSLAGDADPSPDPAPQESRVRTRLLSDGWIATGDLCLRRTDGRITFVGRADDVMVSGGHNVSAVAVEAALRTCPGVVDVAVTGVPHSVLGQAPAAALVVREGVSTVDVAEHAHTRLRPFEIPLRLVIVDELPRTSTGKVVTRELLALLTNDTRPEPSPDPSEPSPSEAEQLVIDAFQRLLPDVTVQPGSDFLALGGYSLLAARVAADLSDRTGASVSPQHVLRRPVVRELAAWLMRRR